MSTLARNNRHPHATKFAGSGNGHSRGANVQRGGDEPADWLTLMVRGIDSMNRAAKLAGDRNDVATLYFLKDVAINHLVKMADGTVVRLDYQQHHRHTYVIVTAKAPGVRKCFHMPVSHLDADAEWVVRERLGDPPPPRRYADA